LLPGAPGTPTSVALTPGATYPPASSAPPAPAPSATGAPRPTRPPAAEPAPTTAAPTPPPRKPAETHRPDVCVPVIGLCVDPLVAAVPKL
ncbi:hypothetical protein JHN59_22610, partial [Streptomyces sp. MBT49]|nr:hypothetical protein [Streptomyces sp. MBT49]